MRFAILFSFFIVALASAVEPLDRFKPKQPEPLAGKKETKPEAKPSRTAPKSGDTQGKARLRGLAFVASKPQLRADGAKAEDGVRISGVPMLDNPSFRARIAKFIGQSLNFDLVNAVAAETARYFKEHNHPVVSVVAPRQDVTDGVVKYLVTEARLGVVRITGNRHFKSSLFKTGLSPGGPIVMSTLENDSAFYGRNPFRSVTAEMSPGQHPGETDVVLRVQDQFPLRVFAGYDNSGVQSTGEHRLFTGFNYGNLFGLGHELSYQFSSSTDFAQLLAHSATWTMPLPWHDVFAISGTYSESNPKSLGAGLQLKGTSWQVGPHYTHFLPPVGKLKHEITLGFDFKYTDNNLQFGGVQVFSTPIDVSEFSLAYNALLPDRLGRTALALAGFWAPGGIGSNNNNAAFMAARQGSTSDYLYATLGIDRTTKLPLGLTWSLTVRGQLASGNLPATEQFLLGGQGTVRGYNELSAAGDQGVLVRNEIYLPSFSVGKLTHVPQMHDEFQFLVFHDFGVTSIKHPLIGETKNTELQSAGVGARWQIRQNLSAHFDYGWQINDLGFRDKSRAHVGVTLSF